MPGDKKYHIVYKTLNPLNGKVYVGVHSTNKIEDGYIGCGIYSQAYADSYAKRNYTSPFINAVCKYGYDTFKRSIVHIFDTIEDAYDTEKEIVDDDFVSSPKTYNASLGGLWTKRLPKYLHLKEELTDKIYSGISVRQLAKDYGISIQGIRSAVEPLDRSKIRNLDSERVAKRRAGIEKRKEDKKVVVVFNDDRVVVVNSFLEATRLLKGQDGTTDRNLARTANVNNGYKEKGFRVYTMPYYRENGASYPKPPKYRKTRYSGMILHKNGETIEVINSYQLAKTLGVSENFTRKILSGEGRSVKGWRLLR